MTTLKGIFPDPKPARRKNFIQENVKSLRKMEQYFHTNKNIEDFKNLNIHRQQKVVNKYQNVTSKVNVPKVVEAPSNKSCSNIMRDSKSEKLSRSCKKLNATDLSTNKAMCSKNLTKVQERFTIDLPKDGDKIRQTQKSTIKPNKTNVQTKDSVNSKTEVKFRNQGIQTLDDKKLENLYAEGIIRYATKRDTNKNEESIDAEKIQPNPTSEKDDCKSPKNEINYIKLNKERTAAGNKLPTLNNTFPPSSYRKGVVPKYLQERKEALKKEEKAKIEAAVPPDCPAGHIPIPDEEKKETLRMLKKRYEECIVELNKLPIRTDTLRAQRQKMEIERQLIKLEEGIKVFSRPKVFIQVDE